MMTKVTYNDNENKTKCLKRSLHSELTTRIWRFQLLGFRHLTACLGTMLIFYINIDPEDPVPLDWPPPSSCRSWSRPWPDSDPGCPEWWGRPRPRSKSARLRRSRRSRVPTSSAIRVY